MYTFDENIARLEEAKNDIKAAIEEKGVFVGNGLIDTYASKIKMITGSGKPQIKTKTISTNNSTTTIIPDNGYDSLSKVTVYTEIPIQKEKSESITDNGTYTIAVDEGYEGLKKVKVNVDVEIPETPIQDKKTIEVITNGTYNVAPDEGYEGLKNAEVEVNIPIQESKTVSISKNGTVEVKVDEGYEGLKKVNVNVDVQDEGELIVLPDGICLKESTFTELDMGRYDWSNVHSWTEMFNSCSNLTILENVPQNVIAVGSLEKMFNSCKKLTSIDLSGWNTSKVTNMYFMFSYCSKLKEIKMGGDVSNVTNVNYMFNYIANEGTFYYNSAYDYSKILAQLPSSWTAVPME